MLLSQIVYTISIHVFKYSLSQLDKERVVSPSLGENLHKVNIRCPSWQLVYRRQSIVVQEVSEDAQKVVVEVCTIVAQVALFDHVVIELDELLGGHNVRRLASYV